jgi:hypothetical protein
VYFAIISEAMYDTPIDASWPEERLLELGGVTSSVCDSDATRLFGVVGDADGSFLVILQTLGAESETKFIREVFVCLLDGAKTDACVLDS